MRIANILLAMIMTAILAACGGGGSGPSKFRTYNGPEVTRIEVHKGERRMYLLHHAEVLKTYDIALGFTPEGHKRFEGDGKTPEGHYVIDRLNPKSRFHLSLGVSYPNLVDRAHAAANRRSPGGDIFIHGQAGKHRIPGRGTDWTDGCIAVTDEEMEEIYSMVRVGTHIAIYP